MHLKDKILLEKLITKYTKNGVKTAINRLNEFNDSEQYIEINGDEYVLVDPYDRIDPEEWDDSFAMINCLKKGECMSYYNGTWCYRDINGKIWQCYKDDQENYWSI